VRRDQLGHLEHGHLALAPKEGFELIVGEDIALVGGVLEVVFLDVDPELFNDLATGHRARAYDRLELGREVKGLE